MISESNYSRVFCRFDLQELTMKTKTDFVVSPGTESSKTSRLNNSSLLLNGDHVEQKKTPSKPPERSNGEKNIVISMVLSPKKPLVENTSNSSGLHFQFIFGVLLFFFF